MQMTLFLYAGLQRHLDSGTHCCLKCPLCGEEHILVLLAVDFWMLSLFFLSGSGSFWESSDSNPHRPQSCWMERARRQETETTLQGQGSKAQHGHNCC